MRALELCATRMYGFLCIFSCNPWPRLQLNLSTDGIGKKTSPGGFVPRQGQDGMQTQQTTV